MTSKPALVGAAFTALTLLPLTALALTGATRLAPTTAPVPATPADTPVPAAR
ncbi:hypothetical protein ACF09J_34795 [Streptomyces sp. NPDC014889]|uniref:hypothetical protein n=1 Tax=Streptomyces sp. NPDC014889 TaxID=3364928 RepID=UPI0036F6ADF2